MAVQGEPTSWGPTAERHGGGRSSAVQGRGTPTAAGCGREAPLASVPVLPPLPVPAAASAAPVFDLHRPETSWPDRKQDTGRRHALDAAGHEGSRS
ncbi:hypothetical protein [Streptomyces sp. NPDC003697]